MNTEYTIHVDSFGCTIRNGKGEQVAYYMSDTKGFDVLLGLLSGEGHDTIDDVTKLCRKEQTVYICTDRVETPTVYQRKGFESRETYLTNLAQQYNVDEHSVNELAQTLGPDEDFDGLVIMIEDHLCD